MGNRGRVLLALSAALLCRTGEVQATPLPSTPPPSLKPEMHALFGAFRDLQPYLHHRPAFLDPARQQEIEKLLQVLTRSVHSVMKQERGPGSDPGFHASVQLANELFRDAQIRFSEGSKPYAWWRLRGASAICISCHVRGEVPFDFGAVDDRVAALPPSARGEFYLATRQMEKSIVAFRAAALQEADSSVRLTVLRRLLVALLRSGRTPVIIRDELEKLQKGAALTAFESSELSGWIQAVRRWAKEPAATPSLKVAEELILDGENRARVFDASASAVRILRGLAVVHQLLERGAVPRGAAQAEALFLLGVGYSDLTGWFPDELPELFLEQAIRTLPNSPQARKAYRLLLERTELSFSGSGGLDLPAEVRAKLRELHDVAFGIPLPPQG